MVILLAQYFDRFFSKIISVGLIHTKYSSETDSIFIHPPPDSSRGNINSYPPTFWSWSGSWWVPVRHLKRFFFDFFWVRRRFVGFTAGFMGSPRICAFLLMIKNAKGSERVQPMRFCKKRAWTPPEPFFVFAVMVVAIPSRQGSVAAL